MGTSVQAGSDRGIVITPLVQPEIAACAAILHRLPAWFGQEESNRRYVESLHPYI